MLEELKLLVYEANMELPKRGLVTFTWGNVSAVDRGKGLFVIKPSGVPYEIMRPESMVVMDLYGKRVEGDFNPSVDMDTHLVLYRAYEKMGGIVHTHSTFATSWAQAGRAIPCYGTTHADYFFGEIPCARNLTDEELNGGYEYSTGVVMTEKLFGKDPMAVPAMLCKNHGAFAWGKDAADAVHNAVVLEEIAKMAMYTEGLNPRVLPAPRNLQNTHYYRKHGPGATYGQKK